MVINKVLDKIFSSRSNVAVIRALKNYAVGISGREISRISLMSPKSCLKALTSLENLGIVTRIRGGRDHLFTLNSNNFLVNEALLPLLEIELRFFESIKKDIKAKLIKKCTSVFIFGSVSRKEESVESDLDLCIILDKENQRVQVENAISDLNKLLFKKYGVTLAPFYIAVKEFTHRIKTKKSPVPAIIKDGILVYGKSFQKLIYG